MKKFDKDNIAVSKKKSVEQINNVKNIIFYVFACLTASASLAMMISLLVIAANNNSIHNALSVLITGLLTLILALVAVFNYVEAQRSYKTQTSEKQIGNSIRYIEKFNDSYLEDIMLLNRIVETTIVNLNIQIEFKPTLEVQDSKIDLFVNKVDLKNYKNDLFISSCSRFYTSNILSKEMMGYCESVLKDKDKFRVLSNRGRTEIETIFRLKRIRVLNFLESLAISYVNSTIDRAMISVQFKSFINDIVGKMYMLIYNDEGLGCYPYLRIMVNELNK